MQNYQLKISRLDFGTAFTYSDTIKHTIMNTRTQTATNATTFELATKVQNELQLDSRLVTGKTIFSSTDLWNIQRSYRSVASRRNLVR